MDKTELPSHIQQNSQKTRTGQRQRKSEIQQVSLKVSSDILNLIQTYLTSIKFGTKYLYHIIPRIIDLSANMNSEDHKTLSKIVKDQPIYIWYPFLSLIIAKMGNPSFSKSFLKDVVINLLKEYTEQVTWHLISSILSSDRIRKDNTKQIIDDNSISNDKKSIIREMQAFCRYIDKIALELGVK